MSDLTNRLNSLWSMLEEEGYYTKANTAMLARNRIEELEAKLAKPRSLCQGKYLACRIEELEAKLAKAVELALEECPYIDGTGAYLDWWFERRVTLAKLKGYKQP